MSELRCAEIHNPNSQVGGIAIDNNDVVTIAGIGNLTINDGDLVLANQHGIVFGAIPDPQPAGRNVTSVTLNDYEEGTWTPAVDAGTAATFTNTNQNGTYTKIGRQVTLTGEVTTEMSNVTGENAGAEIQLPFRIMLGDPGVCMIRVTNGGPWFGETLGISNNVSVFPAQGAIGTQTQDQRLNVGNVNINQFPAGVGVTLRFDFTYNTDA